MIKYNLVGDCCGIPTVCISIACSMIIGRYVDEKFDKNKDFIENYKIVLGIGLIAFIMIPYFLGDYSKENADSLNLDYKMVYYGEYFIKGTDTSDTSFASDEYNCSKGIKIINFKKDGSKIILDYQNNSGNGYIEVPLLYYTIYTARDQNGKKLDIEAGTNNVIRVNLKEKKSGTITIKPEESGKYFFADMITLITIIVFIYSVFIEKRRK